MKRKFAEAMQKILIYDIVFGSIFARNGTKTVLEVIKALSSIKKDHGRVLVKDKSLIIAIIGIACVQLWSFSWAYASSFNAVLVPMSNVDVDEDSPDQNQDFLLKGGVIAAGWTNSNHLGQGLKQAITYLKFNLAEIPNTDLTNVVSIDSAQLHLLTKEIQGSTNTKYLVTISYCADNSWSETEITWNNRTCKDKNELMVGNSVIVNNNDLPTVYSWDTTNLIREAKSSGLTSITLVITAISLQQLTIDSNSPPCSSGCLVWFWSKEAGGQFGNTAEPTLEIDYSISTPLIDNLTFFLTAILPALGIMVPAIIWFYRRERKHSQNKN